LSCFIQYADWTVEVIDIEAAFLVGTLKEPASLHQMARCMERMVELGFITTHEEAKTTVGELLKSMYGNINAALRFFKEYMKHMILPLMGMVQNLADPCAFVKIHEGKTVCLIAITHVDDTELCGTKVWIEWFKLNVKQHFNYTDLGKLKRHHLGIWYEWKQDEQRWRNYHSCNNAQDDRQDRTSKPTRNILGKK
jgi:hypothetical protein